MAYIGKSPTVGEFIKLDSITTSSTNTYNLLRGGVAFSPESANHMLVSLNGVIQAPETSFSISGSTITFLPSSGTLSSSDSIDFIMVYGNVLGVGVASTVTDSAITKGKLNLISTSGSPGLEVKGDGSSENGTIQLNCSQNSHGVKISSPDHSAGQSYEMVLPTTDVTAGRILRVASVSGSGATGVGQLSFDTGNTPAFEAYVGSAQTGLSASTWTKCAFNTERFDTDSMYDASSNYRFTPTVAGKYFVYLVTDLYSDTTYQAYVFNNAIYKNGSLMYYSPNNANPSYDEYERTIVLTATIDMNGSSDYLEGWARVTTGSGTWSINQTYSYFGAYKIIG